MEIEDDTNTSLSIPEDDTNTTLSLRCKYIFKTDIEDKTIWVAQKNSPENTNDKAKLFDLSMKFYVKASHVFNHRQVCYGSTYTVTFTVRSILNSLFYFADIMGIVVYFNNDMSHSYLYDLKKNTSNFTLEPAGDFEIHGSDFVNEDIPVTMDINYKHIAQLSLIKDARNLLANMEKSDFKIASKDKRCFNVHKGIICMRNEVLCRMINSDMLEKKTGIINLNWHSLIIKELLNYIYTGICDVSESTAYDLLRLSHYLQMADLQRACVKYLESNLNESNILSILKLTDEEVYDLDNLRKQCHDFVKSNKETFMHNENFLKYMLDSMSPKNITFVLQLAHEFQNSQLFRRALSIIKYNYKEVMEIKENKEYIISQPELLLKIFEALLSLLE